jgi:hypothetical protein
LDEAEGVLALRVKLSRRWIVHMSGRDLNASVNRLKCAGWKPHFRFFVLRLSLSRVGRYRKERQYPLCVRIAAGRWAKLHSLRCYTFGWVRRSALQANGA